MNAHKFITRLFKTDLNEAVFKTAPRLVTYSLLLVLFTTLFPFNFYFKNGFSVKEIADSFDNSSSLIDQLGNVLLFLPLGFGLTCLLQTRRLGATAKLAIVLIVSAGLSSTVEVLQAFLPSRAPTLSDIFTNSFGGFMGFLCFHLWKFKILNCTSALIKKSKDCLSIKKLTAGFIGYMVLTFLISSALPSTANLRNWDPNFPLLLGNEQTGDRPWQGYVSEFYMADRAISEEEVARAFSDKSFFASIGDSLVADYRLTGKGSYRDQTGHLPDLSWQGQPPKIQDGTGVFLTSSHWLETANPATSMSRRIRETSQFTLSTTVATADTAQTGPGRIVSLSSDPYYRNFTLGQEGTHLVFRLRTPVTGKNGANPELVVPDIFADTNRHHLVITYSAPVFRLYIDGLQNSHSLELTPEVALFLYLLPSRHLNASIIEGYKILYYAVIFIPLGSFLALLTIIVRGQFVFHMLLMCGGILLPSLMLESILASGSERNIRPENLLFSMLIMTGTILIFKVRAPSWLKSNMVN